MTRPTSSGARRPCILIVDDTPTNIDVLVNLLQDAYELKVANRGARALRICEQDPSVDLILLDVMMPEMDGFEVCRTLRASPGTRDIPIIFLTAKTETDDVVHGFAVGTNDYVAKPFRPAELLARVQTQLTIQAQRREIDARSAELKELLHIVSHDVANQFGAVSMFLELARTTPDAQLASIVPLVDAAVRNGVGLTRLVRTLRTSEDKPIPLAPVPLGPAVAEAALLAGEAARAKSVSLAVDATDFPVMAERHALVVSVLGNLLSNALKFSEPGTTVSLTTEVHPDRVCLTVRDQGEGMPPEVVATLFDVTRSISRAGTAGERGTGFGMPLMQRFVTRFGGTVDVTSRPRAMHPEDHGTEFRIWLRRGDLPQAGA
jgi:two-component system sensor histidine kinase/response regulator